MAGLGIHRRDHPVGCGAPGDAKGPILGLLDVLTDDGGQQKAASATSALSWRPSSSFERLEIVAHQDVDQLLRSLLVIQSQMGLHARASSSSRRRYFTDLGLKGVVADRQQALEPRLLGGSLLQAHGS